MSDEKTSELWEQLKTQRDELRVRMHLARADLKDEWEEMEEKWESAQDKFEEFLEDSGDAAREVQEMMQIIGEEISAAYGRIKQRLDDADKD